MENENTALSYLDDLMDQSKKDIKDLIDNKINGAPILIDDIAIALSDLRGRVYNRVWKSSPKEVLEVILKVMEDHRLTNFYTPKEVYDEVLNLASLSVTYSKMSGCEISFLADRTFYDIVASK